MNKAAGKESFLLRFKLKIPEKRENSRNGNLVYELKLPSSYSDVIEFYRE